MKFNPAEWRTRARDLTQKVRAPVAAFMARKQVRLVMDWLVEPVAAVLLVFTVLTLLVQHFYVPSGSMQPTIAIGDLTLATKFNYGYDLYSIPFMNGPSPKTRFLGRMPTVGDVIVFRLPSNTNVAFVKRLIGLPGDHIQMRSGRLWINGRELPLRPDGSGPDENGPDELAAGEYPMVLKYIETLPNGVEHPIYKKQWDGPYDDTPVYVVPKGYVFMMGDNRDDSLDSRVPPSFGGVGYVPVGNLVGRVFVVLASVDFTNADHIWDWIPEFRFSRLLKAVH